MELAGNYINFLKYKNKNILIFMKNVIKSRGIYQYLKQIIKIIQAVVEIFEYLYTYNKISGCLKII